MIPNSISKHLFIFLLFILSGAGNKSQAAENIIERVYIQTDKHVYLAGENLWAKIYITEINGKISDFSKIAYLELIADSIPYVQQKLDVKKGTADSRIHLPVNLPTGNYRLVAYTRAMRNEGEQVYFSKPVTVYNTFTAERIGDVKKGQYVTNEDETVYSVPSSSKITPDKQAYKTREQGYISLQGLTGKDYSIALSIVHKEELPGMPQTSINAWRQNIPQASGQFTATFLPEYEGHIVLGSIVSENNNLGDVILTPLLAFPGKGISLFTGRVEENNNVSFFTKRIDGTQDIVTSVLSISEKPFRIDIQSPFAPHKGLELPVPVLTENYKNALLERSVGIQAMQAFYGDTIWRTTHKKAHVTVKPDFIYKLDEYTRFTTMQEVITEFVLGVRFRKINNKRFLSILTEERTGFTSANTLVLLDGVPLLDHESIYTYDPLLVEQIELYKGKYIFGGQIFDGIVYFKTYNNDYKGAKLDQSSQLFTYKGTEPCTYFYTPDYSVAANRASRLPDLRHTLLWSPNIENEGRDIMEIPFTTSDLKGEFIVTVEGISKDGQVIHSSTTFRVE